MEEEERRPIGLMSGDYDGRLSEPGMQGDSDWEKVVDHM